VTYRNLLQPGRIGRLELRNRLLMCPMGDSLGNPDGTVSARQAAYFEARAIGGAGLLLVGSVAVAYPAGTYDPRQLGISDDRFLPGLRGLTERAHRGGAAIAAQLVHDGANARADMARGTPRLVPSDPPPMQMDRLSRMITEAEATAMIGPLAGPVATFDCRVASDADIDGVIAAFVDAAARAERAGFDGVELHAGHGYLIDGFLSPATNHRTDAWGGPVENRARLLTTLLSRIKDAVPGFPVWCRLNALEHFRPGGETVEDGLEVAALAAAAGADAIHVSAYADQGVALGVTEAHTPHEPGALVGYAAAVKARVDVPVITFGRLEPADADAAIAGGSADFVAMGRKLLADPDLPAKLARDAEDEIRPCIYQYRCIGNIFLNGEVACVANARTGHEDIPLATTSNPRRILVVGAGPAGLEAACALAESGHSVEVRDRAPAIGGRLAVGGAIEDTLARFVRWQTGRAARAGVTVRLATPVSAPDAAGFDEVVVATGAVWGPAGTPVDQVDLGSVAGRVAILGGGKPALTVALALARRGRPVTVFSPEPVLAPELGLPGRFRLVHEVETAGVTVVIGDLVGEFDAVIGAAAVGPDRQLVQALADAGIAVRVVGDAVAPRGVEGATIDALDLARALA
jgi:2,4-dienoyl-CoA reductase-like NADH-dependent reductase (Old Yellow Enzyme family)